MTVPPPGKGLSVRVDRETSAALGILARCGMTPSDAVRYALQVLADAHYQAWDSGAVEDRFACRVLSVNVGPYDTYPLGGKWVSYEEACRVMRERRRRNERARTGPQDSPEGTQRHTLDTPHDVTPVTPDTSEV